MDTHKNGSGNTIRNHDSLVGQNLVTLGKISPYKANLLKKIKQSKLSNVNSAENKMHLNKFLKEITENWDEIYAQFSLI